MESRVMDPIVISDSPAEIEYLQLLDGIVSPLLEIITSSNQSHGNDPELRQQIWEYLWRCDDWRIAVINRLIELNVTVWIKGEPLTGRVLGAQIREMLLRFSSRQAAQEWARMAMLLDEMQLQQDHHILMESSSVSFEHYLDTRKPGQLTANRASPMRAWAREVLPRLRAQGINPDRILATLEVGALERYVVLTRTPRVDRADKRGRNPALPSAGDPRVAQVLTEYVLRGDLRTAESFDGLRAHPGIVHATRLMDVLASTGVDPVAVYLDLGLEKVDVLAHRLDHGQLGANPRATVQEIIDTAQDLTVNQVKALQIGRPGNERQDSIAAEVIDPSRELVMEPATKIQRGEAPDYYKPTALQPWSVTAWQLFEQSGGRIYRRNAAGEPVRVSLINPNYPKPEDV
jgi:hypothetical protein